MKEASRFSKEFEILLVDRRDRESGASNAAKTQIYWVQESLNLLQNAGLSLNGRLDDPTKTALRAFQTRQQLKVTGKADPPTERRILEELAIENAGFSQIFSVRAIIQEAGTKIEDWTDRAESPPKEKAKLVTNKYRNPKNVGALVLHHMAFKRKDRKKKAFSQPESYLRIRAHFCILFDGRIIQLHPVSRMIWHSNCTSPGSVGVEFEGNFPNTAGKWWYSRNDKGEIETKNEDHPTRKQIEAGRFLIKYLKATNGLKEVLAHRQSSKDRTNDPGPDIWYNVGEWALKNLKVNDGGPGFKCGHGNPLPAEWRNWTDKNLTDGSLLASANSSPERTTSKSQSSGSSSTAKIPKAHLDNRKYAEKLGWDAYRFHIYNLLGYTNSSPSEPLLVDAVAAWQKKNGFSGKDVDGVIGPNTWEKMKKELKISGAQSSSNSSGSSLVGGMLQQGWDWITDKVFNPEKSTAFAKTWGNQEEAGKYLDQVVHSQLPNLSGKPWEQMNASEKRLFNNAWVKERSKLLEERKKMVLSGTVPKLGLAKIPFGFTMPSKGKYAGKGLGIASKLMKRPRLDETLASLHRKGKIKISQIDLDIFQRIANVESSGMVQTLNTYDSGIVSIGFMQFTLHVGKIQEWILLNESAFKKFGIELDKSKKHNFGGNELHYMIKGVDFSNRNDLRWNGWAERFYYAGLDEDVIVAQVQLALTYLKKHLRDLKNRLKDDSVFEAFQQYYNADAYVRGLFQEGHNNRPARSTSVVRDTIQKLGKSPKPISVFLETYTQTMREQNWERLVEETAKGTELRIS